MNRKQFITTGLSSIGIILAPKLNISPVSAKEEEIISLDEIKEFVFAAHNNFDKVKSILEINPKILNCTNQPKKGDFETALGGASHMGRKDIADLLISKGARMDIFCMAFLGHSDYVKMIVDQNRQYLNAPGPHGFTLLHHAKVGGHKALEEWLKNKGLTEMRFTDAF